MYSNRYWFTCMRELVVIGRDLNTRYMYQVVMRLKKYLLGYKNRCVFAFWQSAQEKKLFVCSP
jgi:hypothetical protein